MPYYFKNQEIRDLPDDLKFVKDHQMDWGMFTPRWGRIQGLMRALMAYTRLPDGAAGSLSALVSFMPRLHGNYYIHC